MLDILGKKVREKVTGLEGICTGRLESLYGCNQYCIMPPVKDNKVAEGGWFDEGRIELIGEGIAPEDVAAEKPGGPDCPPSPA